MDIDHTETLADRLNYEPVIFRGSTSTELMLLLTFSAAFWLPAGFLIAWWFGQLAMGVGIAAIAILVTVFYGSTVFQIIKRGRPDYYYQQLIAIGLQRLRLRKTGFVLRSGSWDLGRTQTPNALSQGFW